MSILALAATISASPGVFAEEGVDHAACEAKLQAAMREMNGELGLVAALSDEVLPDEVVLADDEVLADEQVVAGIRLDFSDIQVLTGLKLPKGLAENRARFQQARAQALAELGPRLARIRKNLELMNSGLTFEERLHWLGHQYDEEKKGEEKVAILAQMISMFSIPVEGIYMKLISSGSQSIEMKEALYAKLAKIFKHDPSWRPYLDEAMRKARR
jgi:hypothetical protein